jgi:hypothetical protein
MINPGPFTQNATNINLATRMCRKFYCAIGHMTASSKTVRILLVLILFGLPAFAQNPNVTNFSRNGLLFDYPNGTKMEDLSDQNGQQLVLVPSGGGAQIMVVSRYNKITNEEQLNKARHDVFESFTETLWQELKKMDPKTTRTPAQIEISGVQASGVRLRAVLEEQSGNAEVYYLVLGRRLVLVTLIGSDKEIAAAAAAWSTVRGSLKMEEQQ